MDVEEDSRGEINGEEANVTSLIHWCWSLLLTFESWMFVGQMSVHDNIVGTSWTWTLYDKMDC